MARWHRSKQVQLPLPHKIFILQVTRFLMDAEYSAIHFPGTLIHLYCVFKLQNKKFRGKKKPHKNHSEVQSGDTKQPARPMLPTGDYEMTQEQ